MYVDYEKLVQVLADEVEYAKTLPCCVEGEPRKKYYIQDISFHILRYNTIEHQFVNSYLEDVELECSSTMLVKIWLGNKKKVVLTKLSYSDMPMNPEGLKVFIRSTIYHMIYLAMKNFIMLEIKQNKYSERSSDPVEVYLEKVPAFSDYPVQPFVLQRIEQLSRCIYQLRRIRYTRMSLMRTQRINIVVDSEGRRILESKTFQNLSCEHGYINDQNFVLPMTDTFFFSHDLDLMRQLKSYLPSLQARINDHKTLGFINSGHYPILFDHQSTHVLFHEALVGHLFSGDYIVNDQSTIFKNHEDNNLADINEDYEALRYLTVSVDPTKPKTYGGYSFDNEGIRSQKTVLCECGVVKNFLLTRNSAARLKKLSNGHARAETYQGIDINGERCTVSPEARISHLVIDSHQGLSEAQLVKRINEVSGSIKRKQGFYLEVSSQNGEVDPETGTFTMQFDSCKKVYFDGRVEMINGGSISGTPPDLLSAIRGVGTKRIYAAGLCGSDSGWLPVSSETPKMVVLANFVPNAKPVAQTHINLKRDKYIPPEFKATLVK